MFGIAGFIDLRHQTPNAGLCAMAKRMADTLRHRGSDHIRVWADVAAGIASGHHRLFIIDLSPNGRQPMSSALKRPARSASFLIESQQRRFVTEAPSMSSARKTMMHGSRP
jgi:asparagine synthetase B (glutamine-hydrolysing)